VRFKGKFTRSFLPLTHPPLGLSPLTFQKIFVPLSRAAQCGRRRLSSLHSLLSFPSASFPVMCSKRSSPSEPPSRSRFLQTYHCLPSPYRTSRHLSVTRARPPPPVEVAQRQPQPADFRGTGWSCWFFERPFPHFFQTFVRGGTHIPRALQVDRPQTHLPPPAHLVRSPTAERCARFYPPLYSPGPARQLSIRRSKKVNSSKMHQPDHLCRFYYSFFPPARSEELLRLSFNNPGLPKSLRNTNTCVDQPCGGLVVSKTSFSGLSGCSLVCAVLPEHSLTPPTLSPLVPYTPHPLPPRVCSSVRHSSQPFKPRPRTPIFPAQHLCPLFCCS